MIIKISLFILGGYLFIGFLLGVNVLRKSTAKTDASQKAAVILAAMVAWGYFFVKGIKKGQNSASTGNHVYDPET